jgi:hypothetical protein
MSHGETRDEDEEEEEEDAAEIVTEQNQKPLCITAKVWFSCHFCSDSNSRKKPREVKEEDDGCGIAFIRTRPIEDYGNRASWTGDNIITWKRQFITWMTLSEDNLWIFTLSDQNPPDFWEALSRSGNWSLLAQFVKILCSLPISEAENENIFSIRKFIIGD